MTRLAAAQSCSKQTESCNHEHIHEDRTLGRKLGLMPHVAPAMHGKHNYRIRRILNAQSYRVTNVAGRKDILTHVLVDMLEPAKNRVHGTNDLQTFHACQIMMRKQHGACMAVPMPTPRFFRSSSVSPGQARDSATQLVVSKVLRTQLANVNSRLRSKGGIVDAVLSLGWLQPT